MYREEKETAGMADRLKCLLNGNLEPNIFPFLWLHGENEETIREYMHVIYDANMRAVCVESRPHPDFLGPAWWHDMDIILDEAGRLGMKVWILDDSHFPTGYAAGALENAPEELCRQSITRREFLCPEEGSLFCLDRKAWGTPPEWIPNTMEKQLFEKKPPRVFRDDDIISITAIRSGAGENGLIDLTDQKEAGQIVFRVPDGRWKIVVCFRTRNAGPHRNYINMMDERSCRVLIDTVYEAHYAHYAQEFGRTIAGFFSDEPEIGNDHLYETGKRIWQTDDLGWSRTVEEELRKKWGACLERYLPLLWVNGCDPDLTVQVRFDYMDTVTEAVSRCFSMQIGEWCRMHNVEYIGHLIEDDHQHTRTGSSLGHYFRGLSGQGMAGIDDIGGQVLPLGENIAPFGSDGRIRDGLFYHYTLAKLGTSLAAIDPKKKGRTMCEIFGAYGWKEGLRLEKYLADHFLVRGVNRFVPHAFSMKAFPDPDCPPHFYAHGHNPQYRHFAKLMAYMSRLCTLTDGVGRVARAAVLYNASAEWTGKFQYLQDVAAPLLDRQIDFDILPEDIFAMPDRFGTVLGEKLSVNGRTYDVLLITEMHYMSDACREALNDLENHGFPVLSAAHHPEKACEKARDLLRHDMVTLIPENNRIRVLRFRNRGELFFLINEGEEPWSGSAGFPVSGEAALYDPWENRLYRMPSGESVYPFVIHPGKSICVIFGLPRDLAAECPGPEWDATLCRTTGETKRTGTELREGWTRSVCEAKRYPAFRDARVVSLPDHLAEEQPKFSGFVRYERELNVDEPPKSMLLEISDAFEGVELFVNGHSAGIQISPPFLYSVADLIQKGENRIVIEVATSLERKMAGNRDVIFIGDDREREPACPSGINGTVTIYTT